MFTNETLKETYIDRMDGGRTHENYDGFTYKGGMSINPNITE